jgi:hypothetical protein
MMPDDTGLEAGGATGTGNYISQYGTNVAMTLTKPDFVMRPVPIRVNCRRASFLSLGRIWKRKSRTLEPGF